MPSFSQEIAKILSQVRHKADRVVNFIVVEAYWEVGCRIVEEEQEGANRAEYGSNLLKHLSIDLKKCLGKRFAHSNLSNMREFYTCFPNFEAVRQELSWIAKYSVINENKQCSHPDISCICLQKKSYGWNWNVSAILFNNKN